MFVVLQTRNHHREVSVVLVVIVKTYKRVDLLSENLGGLVKSLCKTSSVAGNPQDLLKGLGNVHRFSRLPANTMTKTKRLK